MMPTKTHRRERPAGRSVPFVLRGLLAALFILFGLCAAPAPALAVVSGDFIVSEGGEPVGEARVDIVVEDEKGEERKVGGSLMPSGEDGEAPIAIDDDAKGKTATVVITRKDGSTTRISGFRIPWGHFADYAVNLDLGVITHALWFSQSTQSFTDIRGDWLDQTEKLRIWDTYDPFRTENPFRRYSWSLSPKTAEPAADRGFFFADGTTLLDTSPDNIQMPYFQFDPIKPGPDGIPTLTFTIYTEAFGPGTAGEFFNFFAPDFVDSAFLPDETAGFGYNRNSIFVNDRWQLNDHWSFNTGFRYEDVEGNEVTKPAGEAGAQGTDFDWETITPRVGITYALGAERKTLLRSSFARFAEQLGTSSLAGAGRDFSLSRDETLESLFESWGEPAEDTAAAAGPPVREYEPLQLVGRYRITNHFTTEGTYEWSLERAAGAPAAEQPAAGWVMPLNPRLDGFKLGLGQSWKMGLGSTLMLRDLGQRAEHVMGQGTQPDGHITVDFPIKCGFKAPAQGNLFGGPANNSNILWGDQFTIDPQSNTCAGTAKIPFRAGAYGSYYNPMDTYYGGFFTAGLDADYDSVFTDEWIDRFILKGPFIEPIYGAQGEIPAGAAATKPGAEVQPAPVPDRLPSDPYFHAKGSWGQDYDDQWGLKRIGFAATGRDGKGALWPKKAAPVVVAVVDTGLDVTHPDLRGVLWANFAEIPNNGKDEDGNGLADDFIGWNFINDDNDIRDTNGHGTVVAGIIAAGPDNALGITGVNPWARILPVKVTDYDNTGNSVDVAKGIAYAARMGARVINVSIGTRALSKVEQAAVNYATRQGALVVVAAGNKGVNTADYSPAGLEGVITVAATAPDDSREPYSNWGAEVDIAAPGKDILSLRAIQTDLMLFAEPDYEPGANMVGRDRNYYRVSGTSFAAPFVSGVASLIFAVRPDLDAEQVKRMILHSARDIETPGWDQYTGYGLLDAAGALKADPAFFTVARIERIAGVKKDGKVRLQVTGSATADAFKRAWVEAGEGDDPAEWKKVSADISAPVDHGVLALLEAGHFKGAKAWTVRLIVEHENGAKREARFRLKLG